MAKPFAKRFYASKSWKQTRQAYKQSVGGLCERCLSKGIITPGKIVHHKTPLTPEGIQDPSICLGWDNLELVCRDCHAAIHEDLDSYRRKNKKRYWIDQYGRVHPR